MIEKELKEMLLDYRIELWNKWKQKHEDLRFGKTVLNINDISDAYFCEKMIDIKYKQVDIMEIKVLNSVILNQHFKSDEYLISIERNGVFIFDVVGIDNIKVDGNSIKLHITTKEKQTNKDYCNNNNEVFARTICLCIENVLNKNNPQKNLPTDITYKVEYISDDNKCIAIYPYRFDMSKKIKALDDIDFSLGYWINKRDAIKTKVPVKHSLCKYVNECK